MAGLDLPYLWGVFAALAIMYLVAPIVIARRRRAEGGVWLVAAACLLLGWSIAGWAFALFMATILGPVGTTPAERARDEASWHRRTMMLISLFVAYASVVAFTSVVVASEFGKGPDDPRAFATLLYGLGLAGHVGMSACVLFLFTLVSWLNRGPPSTPSDGSSSTR
ncbi:MAG: hypothetical protein ACKVU4_13560 [Phycisphaerales bacterium]